MKEHLEKLGNVTPDVDLTNYNTYKIFKEASFLLSPFDINCLISALKYFKENNIKYIIIGNGSNIVFSDQYFDGVIIKLNNFNEINITDDLVVCGAGVMLPNLVMQTINNNLTGLEWAFGIPGNVGGSIAGNAGAYNSCIFEYVQSITFIDDNLKINTLSINEMTYGYRSSIFKENKNWIIVEVTFKLNEGSYAKSKAIIDDRFKRRNSSQPLEYPSAGSVFRNLENEDPAGKIIEELNFKGKNIGGAYVSEKHANFIINKEVKATGLDIKQLIDLIKKNVKEKRNIDLIVEQEFIDW